MTVAVEPGGLDTTTMVIEDFTSQQYITDTVPPAATADLITIEYQAAEAEEGPGSPTQGRNIDTNIDTDLITIEYQTAEEGPGSPTQGRNIMPFVPNKYTGLITIEYSAFRI